MAASVGARVIPLARRRYKRSTVQELRQALLAIETSARAHLASAGPLVTQHESIAFIRMQSIQKQAEEVLFSGPDESEELVAAAMAQERGEHDG